MHIDVSVIDQGRPVYQASVVGPVEFGRQDKHEEPPYTHRRDGDALRFIIAKLDEVAIPRKSFRLEPGEHGRCRLTNLGRVWVKVEPGAVVQPSATCDLVLPAAVVVGPRTIRLQPAGLGGDRLQSLVDFTLPPSHRSDSARAFATIARSRLAEGQLDAEALGKWIQASMSLLHSAASSAGFYAEAARAIVDLVGLDSGRVLLRQGDRWAEQAVETAAGVPADAEWVASRHVVQRVLQEKRTFWQSPEQAAGASLQGVSAVVAAPILDSAGDVIGLLYGEQRSPRALGRVLNRLEAMLVEMLACGVAAGLARVEQEQAALRARVQMEQFFTPELSRQLAENPDLLTGRDGEVTMLSCDIRGFSRICDRLGPTRTLEWLNDVLGALSDCVLAEQGVLVDYVGDELMAMWGAPEAQPDHPARACRAALAMLEQVPTLNERWRDVIAESMDLSIGVNSGVARVGNVGSRRKFKYGALGTTTNLASRVQGANKYLRTRLLVTEATRQRLGDGFTARRLCRIRVVNIADPVTLYELARPGVSAWDELRQAYEVALTHFERRELREAARILGEIITRPAHAEDGPALVLLQRAVTGMVEKAQPLSDVWELPGK